MNNLIELFKKLEELSKSFEIFKCFKGDLSGESSDVGFDIFNINLFNLYKKGAPLYLSSILPKTKNAEFYMNKIQKMYLEFGYEKIYREIKEIPFFKLNSFDKSGFNTYFKILNKFSPYDFKIQDIEKSFSEGFLEINNSKRDDNFSDFSNPFIFRREEKYEECSFDFEEDFDRFGEKLADVLKTSIKYKDRAKGY